MSGDLPFVDEHQVVVAAPVAAVWRSLTAQVTDSFGRAGTVAHLVGADPRRGAGTPLDQGATLPGFLVAEAVPESFARLTGRHRFSRYALTLTVAAQPDGTLLSAHSDAAFPGPHGRLYRALVIGSGAHRLFVRRLLDAVRRHAETPSSR